jgi:predicted RNA binding protein YcfA (HicA-like mRNA interferase family)
MPKRYPPLSRREVLAILKALGFELDRTAGSHENYVAFTKEKNRVVTVATNKSDFPGHHVKTFIRQSGFSREDFYGAIKSTAKKINF